MDLSTVRVPGATTTCIIVTILITLVLPLVLMVVWSVKTRTKFRSAIYGAATFILFAMILESFLNRFVVTFMGQEAATALPFCAIYGGLAAGIFEECGRYITMRYVMKIEGKKEAVLFGLGHGGIESIIITGMAFVSNLIIVGLLNAGTGNMLLDGMDEATAAATVAQLSPLWESSPALFLVAGLERIFAMTFHVCASYIVYRAVKDSKPVFLVLAVALHALMDGIMVTIAQLTGSTLATELFIAVFAIAVAVLTVREYLKDKSDEVEVIPAKQVTPLMRPEEPEKEEQE